MTRPQDQFRWVLTLYVHGACTQSMSAVETIRRICDEDLAGQADLRVVDVHDDPAQVAADNVLAVPTLVKRLPTPLRQLVGDLADSRRVRVGLELGPAGPSRRDVARGGSAP